MTPASALSARVFAVAAGVAVVAACSVAHAQPVTAPPRDIGGELRRASPPNELALDVLDVVLFVPRKLVQIVFVASTATASFFEDQQIIPRAQEVLTSSDGKLGVAPTLSLVSGFRPEVGARATAVAGSFASMLRGSIVDRDTYLVESRLLFTLDKRGRTQLVLEGFHQRRTDQGFAGLGPDPLHDSRNAFLPGHEGLAGVFLESRQRAIASFGARVEDNIEVLLSQSYQRRAIEDARNEEDVGLARTFAPGSVPGAYATTERLYSEVTVRRDTRLLRGPPSPGFLFEAYGGSSEDAHETYAPALHAGGRIGWFVPLVRATTILSPRASLDVISPRGDRPLPFREYSYASGYRGTDGRVDRVAALVSVDHRWQLVPYVAARLFVDVTTVAPSVQALRTDHLAWAVGAGVDLHSSTTEIGRIGFSYSPAAIQLLLTFGIAAPGFGDRQHRLRMKTRHFFSLLCIVVPATGSGCHYRPARFADRPMVAAVEDDKPIPVPGWRTYDERELLSDIYLRRPIFDVTEARDFPTGGDVNQMDEVARSTWYSAETSVLPAGPAPADTAPPLPPLVPLDENPLTLDEALVVRDARGVRYELLADPPGHVGLRTGADVVAGRLLRVLGYRTPSAAIVTLPVKDVDSGASDSPAARRFRTWVAASATPATEFVRVSASPWPPGIDVGITGDFGTRGDDPNDVVDHQDRRTMRALKVFGEWLGWGAFGVRSTRDVYVGKAGEGHVLHYLVAMARALGTEDVRGKRFEDHFSLGKNLITLGLAPATPRDAQPSAFSSLGYLPASITAGSYDVSPAFSPFVRATPSDLYWAAKRLMAVDDATLATQIAFARLPVDAAEHLRATLSKRRRAMMRYGVDEVTPIDASATSGASVWLEDRAIEAGLEDAAHTRYDIRFLDDAGRERTERVRLPAVGPVTSIALPASLEGLVVLHVRSVRRGVDAPRPCDIHIMMEHGVARILAVRH